MKIENLNPDFGKNDDGLLPAIIQHFVTGEVLMLGYMNEEALTKTEKENKVTFYSRSRNELWTKGATSGHFLLAKEILVDCDQDTLVIKAEARGPGVCHNGFRSCFYRRLKDGAWEQVDQRSYDPKSDYKSSSN